MRIPPHRCSPGAGTRLHDIISSLGAEEWFVSLRPILELHHLAHRRFWVDASKARELFFVRFFERREALFELLDETYREGGDYLLFREYLGL
jgi:hypothetical protein